MTRSLSLIVRCICVVVFVLFFFCQAEDGIRDLVRSRGLGDVYKRQFVYRAAELLTSDGHIGAITDATFIHQTRYEEFRSCLLYTSDAADERSSVDLGGRRIIKKKKKNNKQ